MSLEETQINSLNDDLVTAVEYNMPTVVSALLSVGANVHAWDNYALRWAARRGRTDIAKLLLEHGADISSCDNEALRSAAFYFDVDTIKVLVEHGTNVEETITYMKICNYHPKTIDLLEQYL